MRPADWTLAREPTVSVMRAVRPDRSGSMKRAAPRSVVEAIRGGGDPLAPAVRDHWESRLGQDLTRVRVHSDGHAARAADAIDASAFTVGRHIAFGTGYGVTSDNGRLLGHELAHTVQQGLAEAPNHELVVGPANAPPEAAARRVSAGSDGGMQSLDAQSKIPRPASPIRVGSSAVSVQREERAPGEGGGTAATTTKQKPVKIEGTVPAAELQKHAAGGAAAGGPATASKTPPANAALGKAPTPSPKPTPGKPSAVDPPKTQAPTKAPEPAKTPEPKPPPSATASADKGTLLKDAKGTGVDLQVQPQTPLAGAGDFQLPINIIVVEREGYLKGDKKLNLGFEPQLIITPVGVSGAGHYQPAIAAGIDLLHWKINDDLDWHIAQAQVLAQGDIPTSGRDSATIGGGGQIGTGVERALPWFRSGDDERFTVGANLAGQAVYTSDGKMSYSFVGSIFITWHIKR
jgi:Domain of unknown function (DUF4157)